ncbi:MAG: helicase-associated domain-containing protein [Anaerolineae bacterium]|nr:helicase-associated domain-containing protein [Anaerolineae bacterium]
MKTKTVHECLSEYDNTLLRAIAEKRGVELATFQHDEMANEMAVALLDPTSIAETLTWLTEQERTALDTLLTNGGRLRIHRFTLQFGEIRRFGPGSLAREAPWRTPISPAEGLWYRGMVARSFMEQDGISSEFVFIPSDLVPLLPIPQTQDISFDIPYAKIPHRIELGDPALVDDLCILLALIQTGDIHINQGQLTPEAAALVQKQSLIADQERVEFLYHLAQEAEFVHGQGRKLDLNREPVRTWLKQTRMEQLQRLQHTWYNDASWNDLWHVPTILCEDTGWHNDPFAARQTVLDLLKRCTIDAWLSISGLVEIIKDQSPDYLRPDGDFESWYIRDRRTAEYLTGFEHWDKIDGALITYLFAGPLHWLGMVSLGYQEGWNKPTAIRLTPWGLAFLGQSDVDIGELPAHPAQVTPEGWVTLPRQASLYDRFQLARIADWRASKPDYVYEITPESLRRAFGTQIQVEMVERFLSRIAQEDVPAATIARLRAWANRYGHVRLRKAVILETRTQKTMLDLQAHDRIRPYLRQSFTPTTVLVRESDWDILIQELERAGYLPEIINH